MVKAIPVAVALTIGISTFGVESAWIPNIVKRIEFGNAPAGSSSNQDSKPSSADSKSNPTNSKPAAAPTSKSSTPTSQPAANSSKASSKSAPSSAAPAQSNSATSAVSGSSTSPIASSAASFSATNSIASATSSESTIANQESSKSTSSSGAIGAVVAMGIIIVIGAIAYLIVRRKKAKQNRVKMVEKSDPFTMGYGNHDPLPYKEMNNTSMNNSTYPTNETYTNEANPLPSTQMGFTENTPQSLQTTSNDYNTNPASAISPFSQPQVSAVPAAFDGNAAPVVTPSSQNINFYTVVATYIPTLSDELDLGMGDQIELEAEFDDGWCQGKNITKGGTAGVFPRHCIDRVASTNNQAVDVARTKRVSSIRIQ